MKRTFTLGLLVALAVITGIANAEIIGTDDFSGGKTGWNYGGGTSGNWSSDLTQDGKMVVSNTTTYITFNGTETTGKVPTGSTTFKVDYTATALNTAQWSGVSFFATGAEKYFWGRSGNNEYFNIAQANANAYTNVKVEKDKTYTIIGSRSVSNMASYMWVVEPGTELTYADYRRPAAQVTTGNTFSDLTRVRLGAGTNETIAYDNLTVATKASDIFGTVALDENKPLYSETFSGYKTGAELVGQKYTSQGGMPSATWLGDTGKATVSTTGLSYEGYQSAAQTGGMLAMNGQYLYVAPDDVLMDSAGLLASDGYYGGNDSSGTLYIGFLTQSDAYPSWGAAIQLYRSSGSEILGLGKNGGSSTFSIFGSASGGLVDLNTNGATLDDKKTHLVIAKIDYNANADDNITFYFDPDLSKPESEQAAASITTTTGNAAFDTLRIRNGANASVWNVDEIRLGTTWNSLLQSNVNPAESTFKTTPIVTESFSGYSEGAINGQAYQGTGEAYKGAWQASNASIVDGRSLEFAGWESKDGLLSVPGGASATMNLDNELFLAAGLVDANGNIGGESVKGTVYYGFLLNGHGARSWSGGAELYLDGAEVLGLGQFSGASAFSGFAKSPSGRNFDLNSANHEATAAYEWVDNDDHLIIARIDFNPDSTDILTVYFDPDLTLSEAEQDAALKTVLEGYNLAFDQIIFRNGAAWDYDEFRMGLTWDSIVGANNSAVPEPSTWALLILGSAGLLLIRRHKASK